MHGTSPDVLIIGGGLAGLTAGTHLTSRGRSVLLIEHKQRLGGRTYSFRHPETGDEVDNGQHLMMGCYHATLRYLRLTGRMDAVTVQDVLSIVFRHPDRPADTLRTLPLPAPLHVAGGLLRLKSLSFSERMSMLRVGAAILFTDPDADEYLSSRTVAQWLDELKQPEANKKFLWDIIAIGALNDSTEKISAALFVKVLRSAFLWRRRNAAMVIPKRGLSPALVEGGEQFIRSRGGTVRTETSLRSFAVSNGKITAVTLSDGSVISPAAVISAVPYFDIPKVFPDPAAVGLTHLESFVSSPIITVHLWLDAHCVPEPFAALIDSPFHWVFNKSLIYGADTDRLMYLSLVVSGAHALAAMEKEELVALAHQELQRFYPSAVLSNVIHSAVIKEKRATFSPSVGMERYRPSHRSPVTNLFFAGDWTDTKLPATIEGAVQSGEACAELCFELFRK